MRLAYRDSEEAWSAFEPRLLSLIEAHQAHSVCDIGGGANPVLSVETIERLGLEYTVLDISEEELAKAPESYRKVAADIAGEAMPVIGPFDLVFSKMLAEHVRDPERFHSNVLQLLKPGGIAYHFFPTLYAFPFWLNRIVPEALAQRVLGMLTPHRTQEGKHGKFVAYYRWCRGPMKSQIRRLESAGFEVLEYDAFFGHEGYYRRLGPLLAIHRAEAGLLRKLRWNAFTSFAFVVLRKR